MSVLDPRPGVTVCRASFAELDRDTLYDLLALRSAVFVVGQACAYLDIDGRDREQATEHHWVAVDGRVVSALRVLVEPDGAARIGRVCTLEAARGCGYAARLVSVAAADRASDVVLAAQSHLRTWYERLGFTVDGPEFEEVGILHVPMRRRSGTSAGGGTGGGTGSGTRVSSSGVDGRA